jgi:AraC-like DNA-binding protein
MYNPVQDGIATSVRLVHYAEVAPPKQLAQLVHCFWELRTLAVLSEDFRYHALPDACVNLLLNQTDTDIAGITALQTASTVLNLGTSFHYVGVQLLPGVWQGDRGEIVASYVGTPYRGKLPLVQTSERIVGLAFEEKVPLLVELVHWCIAQGHIVPNTVTARILAHLDGIRSVADMAQLVGMSPRHLQRTLKRATGFTPHNLLKVLRVQQSFRKHHLDLYADQAHFIHEFRRATGYTPGKYRKQFGV